MKESERIQKLQKHLSEIEMPTNELDKVILDLKNIIFYEDIKRAKKADTDKLKKFFIKWEWKIDPEKKILINSLMSYINNIKNNK